MRLSGAPAVSLRVWLQIGDLLVCGLLFGAGPGCQHLQPSAAGPHRVQRHPELGLLLAEQLLQTTTQGVT